MKKSFMTRVLAVSLSAAMAFSLPSANLMTASAAATVTIAKTATVKVGNTKTLKLKKNNSDWKITKVATNKKKVCTAKKKSKTAFTITGVKKGNATISVTIQSPKRKAAKKAKSKWQKVLKTKVTVNPKTTTPTTPTTPSTATDPTTPTSATDPTGATTPTDPTGAVTPTGELGITTVKSLARTTVEVVFNQPVDAITKDNFKITEKASETTSVDVTDAILSENKLVATLTLADSAKLGTDYKIAISGLTCGSVAQKDIEGEYTSLTTADQYVAVMESDATYLKADNVSNTQIRFSIYDGTGKLRTDVNDVEVRFTTNGRGTVGGQSVVVRNGVATVQFTSTNQTSDVTAIITGEVIKADGHGDLLGLKSTTSILLTLNPESIEATKGAFLTSINTMTADRIIAYFDTEVKPEWFLTNGKPDLNKVEVYATDRVGLGNEKIEVETILPLTEGKDANKALQILLEKPLTDNSEVSLYFADKRSNLTTSNTAYDRLVDATQPAVYNVEVKNLRTIRVYFSEAVLTNKLVNDLNNNDPIKALSAEIAANYRINGQRLDQISSKAEAKVVEGSENRHIVELTLGKENNDDNGKPIYLTPNTLYSVQVSNVGDWAALTDGQMNVVHTQTFYFTAPENNDEPTGTVTIQSPEQYLVKFNGEVAVSEGVDRNKTLDKLADLKDILELQQIDSRGNWQPVSYNGINNPIRIRKGLGDNEYIVELTADWTQIHNTSSTTDNYYRHKYRLHIDQNAVYNYGNGKVNSKAVDINLSENTATGYEKMLNPDNDSPEIQDVTPVGKWYYVQMNEPVQVPMDDGSGREPTPSQDQVKAYSGIQQPTARFVNTATKETIIGNFDKYLYVDDTWVRIEPEKVLSAGEWELTITALTDDIGNTIKSNSYKFTVAGSTATSGLHVVWAAVSNTDDYETFREGAYATNANEPARYIFIKFSEPMSNTALATSALVSSNYTVSGTELTREANVTAGIKNYSITNLNSGFDSVTIDLGPNYARFNLNERRQAAITIASSITAISGNVLGTPKLTLPHNYGTNDTNITKVNRYSQINTGNDDVWGNDPKESGDFSFDKVQAALDNEIYRTVKLPQRLEVPAKATLRISRPVELDLNGNDIDLDTNDNSNMTVAYTDTGIVKVMNTSTTNAEIVCRDSDKDDAEGVSLYDSAVVIDTPNTDVWIGGKERTDITKTPAVLENVTGGKVTIGCLNVRDILTNSLVNFYGKIDALNVTDGGGTSIVNKQRAEISNLVLNGSARFVLTNEGTMSNVFVTRANTVEVKGSGGSQPIGYIKCAKGVGARLVLNTENAMVNSLVSNVGGFDKVVDTSGTDIGGKDAVYKALNVEVDKIVSTTITSGQSVVVPTDTKAENGNSAGSTLSVEGSPVVTYKAELVNKTADEQYLNIDEAGTTITSKKEFSKKISVRVTATVTVGGVDISEQKVIEITYKK